MSGNLFEQYQAYYKTLIDRHRSACLQSQHQTSYASDYNSLAQAQMLPPPPQLFAELLPDQPRANFATRSTQTHSTQPQRRNRASQTLHQGQQQQTDQPNQQQPQQPPENSGPEKPGTSGGRRRSPPRLFRPKINLYSTEEQSDSLDPDAEPADQRSQQPPGNAAKQQQPRQSDPKGVKQGGLQQQQQQQYPSGPSSPFRPDGIVADVPDGDVQKRRASFCYPNSVSGYQGGLICGPCTGCTLKKPLVPEEAQGRSLQAQGQQQSWQQHQRQQPSGNYPTGWQANGAASEQDPARGAARFDSTGNEPAFAVGPTTYQYFYGSMY